MKEASMRLKRGITVPALAAALLGIVLMALAAPAEAVPAFARQTHMSCNQCHTTHGGPVPNFTMTGKKFRSTGYRMIHTQEAIESGAPGDMGERMYLPLLDYWSMRFESQLMNVSRNPFSGDWGEATTNPTSRLAMFFVGPFGDHFGIWNEWYFHTLGSADNEWSLDLASWDEYDLRYTINPDNPKNIFGIGLTNQPVYDVLGFGPFPVFAGGREAQRGEIGGYAHPNYATAFVNGWMNDRFSWLLGGNTGDTNTDWIRSNFIGEAGYAFLNTDANELWVHAVLRTGSDVMPLVTQNYVKDEGRDWSYEDAVRGVSETRPDSTAYLAKDIDTATTIEGEVIWERQDWGPHSFEAVFRIAHSTESYKDGGSTDLTTLGIDVVYTWRHTFYLMPFWNTMATYDFTTPDVTATGFAPGKTYGIGSTDQYGIDIGLQPTENFLMNLQILKFQVLNLEGPPADKGVSVSWYVDFLL
jgi:hypothetical protein